MKKSHVKNYFLLVLIAVLSIPLSMSAQSPLNGNAGNPPSNLTGKVVAENDAQLSWDAPAADQIALHWDDGENYTSWGFMLNAANFDIASKWDPEHLSSYDEWKIVGVRFFITHPSAELIIKVWEDEDAIEVYSEAVSSFTEDEWTEITLTNPVVIDASKVLRAGLNIDMPVGAEVVGVDDGPAISGYGNLYRYQGVWYSDGEYNNNFQILIEPSSAPRSTQELLGYNVYRDEEQINTSSVNATSYVDKNLFNGTYSYYVKAVYDEGESESSNSIELTVDQPVILESDSLALVDLYNNCNGQNWDLQYNWFETVVSEWIGVETTGTRVTGIILSHNGLEGDIPESFGDLERLSDLRLSGNDIESLPSTFGNLESLNEFWISHTLLTKLPDNFGDLDSLVTLSLSDNELLAELPDSFGSLEMLYWFGMGRTALTSLPDNFGDLDNLFQCYLDFNYLSELPASFGDLENVTYLTLNKNLLTSLPESFGNLSSLKTLDLSENTIATLPESFGNISTLERFSMYNCGLESLPENFGNLTNLQNLSLSINNLTELPASFSNLKHLHECGLDQNLLTVLPEDFGNLEGLYDLSLSQNELTYLPESIGNLDSLLQLFALNNKLESIPESIGDLDNIWILGLDYNQIVEVPESIGNLTKLGYLGLTANMIEELPSTMGNLNADTLLLSSNKIRVIPETLYDHNFNYLWIDDNILQFGSIEPFDGNVLYEYRYLDQDKFGHDTTIYPQDGGLVEFTWEVSGENNVYQWYKEGEFMEGQISNTLTFDDITSEDEGIYTLQVTNTVITDLMIESHNVTVDAMITDVEETEIMDLHIYPNPASGNVLNINSGISEIAEIQIVNTTGSVVGTHRLEGMNTRIDISTLSRGMYFIRTISPNKEFSIIKLIKN